MQLNSIEFKLSIFSTSVQSQEAVLDSSFWNTTLRSDCTVIRSNVNKREKEESDLVFSQGLVALSLMGNKISDKGLGFLRRAIHSNHWLLGKRGEESKKYNK